MGFNMNTLIIQPKNKAQMETVTAFLKALKIDFKKHAVTNGKTIYNAEWVDMIKKSEDDFKKGKVHKINLDEIWK
jgi:hypothetical protein